MPETEKCPRCGEALSYGDAVHHLTVIHQMSLREAVRWAACVGVLGQGDGMGQTRGMD